MRLTVLVLSTAILASACSREAVSLAEPVTQTIAEEITELSATSFTSIDGQALDITGLGAKAVLVVNTASRCGYTPQYKGLQALFEAKQAEGLVIVGVPSNDFGNQEPGTEEDVKTFCEINYGVSFPLTRKYAVTGEAQHPFYREAVARLGEPAQPKWNFHKILVDASGVPIKAYPSSVKPGDPDLLADIEAALGS